MPDNDGPVVLTSAKAKCPKCGHQVGQIDTTRERAIAVVTKAMERHLKEAHPDA